MNLPKPQIPRFLNRTRSDENIVDQESLSTILARTSQEINAEERMKDYPPLDFVELSNNLADGLVKAAEANLSLAQLALKQAKEQAEEIQRKTKAKSDEIQEMTERLKNFSETLIDAHDEFLGKNHVPRPSPPPRLKAPANPNNNPQDDDRN